MAYVRRRLFKDGKTVVYLAMWREHPQGKELSKSFERKADAERHLVDVQHRLLTGTYAAPRLGRTPFVEVALRYRQRGNWRPRTHRTVEERLRYAVEHFGDRPIASIRRGDVQAFVSGLPLAPSTVRVVMQHVTGVFNTALDDGLIGGRNPCDGVRLPRIDAPQIFPLTTEQVEQLLDAAAEPFKAAIVIGAGLGLRQSEAAGLTVDRVDFLRRNVTVDRQWQQATGSATGAFVAPKTEASTRVVPADQWVLDHLAAHIQRHGLGADGVLLHRDGEPFDSAKFGYEVRAARRRAGLPESVTFHDLRHFFASALIHAGCSVKQVQASLGHKSAKVTLDVYGHLWPGEEDRVRDAIGQLFRPSQQRGAEA
ncbi:MAG: site-specific integrase [Acidimicrobiales bacterium]